MCEMLANSFNELIIKKLTDGSIRDYLITEPYPYAVIPDFLEPELFKHSRQKCDGLLKHLASLDGFDISHAYLNVPELLSVFCSTLFLDLISKIFSLNVMRKRDQYPSIRVLSGGGNGLHIHNDREYIGNMTVFLYLSDWKDGNGGEVGIYKHSEEGFIKVNSIKPLPNSVFAMPITDTIMYHDISPTAPGYIRKCAYFPISII